MNGKQKRVKRPPTVDGMDVNKFIRRNADPSSRNPDGDDTDNLYKFRGEVFFSLTRPLGNDSGYDSLLLRGK